MYSPQTITLHATLQSPAPHWNHKSRGWNDSAIQTHYNTSGATFSASNSSLIVDIKVITVNGTSFNRTDITVNRGTVLRFHLPGQNCSLLQASVDCCANKSQTIVDQHIQTLEANSQNGSAVLDYIVDTASPQWIYTVHSLEETLCNSGQVFRINPDNGNELALNSTQSHATALDHPVSTLNAQGPCDSASVPTITSVGNLSSSTGTATNASASQNLQQPFATSLAPELSNHGRKVIVHHRLFVISTLLLGHVLMILM